MMRTRRRIAAGGHEAVGVERHREFVPAAPALAEVADVAGLEAGVGVAAPVGDRDAPAPRVGERREACVFSAAAISAIAGVAQHIEMEAIAPRLRRRSRQHRLEIADDAVRRFVADAQQDARSTP